MRRDLLSFGGSILGHHAVQVDNKPRSRSVGENKHVFSSRPSHLAAPGGFDGGQSRPVDEEAGPLPWEPPTDGTGHGASLGLLPGSKAADGNPDDSPPHASAIMLTDPAAMNPNRCAVAGKEQVGFCQEQARSPSVETLDHAEGAQSK